MTDEQNGQNLIKIDHRINIGVLVAVLVQMMGVSWMLSNMASRITNLETTQVKGTDVTQRLTRIETIIETRMEGLRRDLEKLEASIGNQ